MSNIFFSKSTKARINISIFMCLQISLKVGVICSEQESSSEGSGVAAAADSVGDAAERTSSSTAGDADKAAGVTGDDEEDEEDFRALACGRGGVSLAQKLHDEFLVCKICLEDFRNPKCLECMHTFCEQCIETHVFSETSYKKYSDYRKCIAPMCAKTVSL